jgi:dTMP kinase
MDMDWAQEEEESFRIFQGRVLSEYDRMVKEFDFTVIDGTQPIQLQQRQIRAIVNSYLTKPREKAVLK